MLEELRPFLGQSRQRVKPRLAGFLAWLQAQQIQGGPGIRIHRTNVGTSISLAEPFPSFIGAFYCSLNDNLIRVGPGFVNGVMPVNIDEKFPVEISEKTYVMVQVRLDENKRFAPEGVTIEVGTKKYSEGKLLGRHPVALVYQGRIWQLSYFSLNHIYREPRHFFVPA